MLFRRREVNIWGKQGWAGGTSWVGCSSLRKPGRLPVVFGKSLVVRGTVWGRNFTTHAGKSCNYLYHRVACFGQLGGPAGFDLFHLYAYKNAISSPPFFSSTPPDLASYDSLYKGQAVLIPAWHKNTSISTKEINDKKRKSGIARCSFLAGPSRLSSLGSRHMASGSWEA